MVGIQIGARTVPVLPSNTGAFYVRSGAAQGTDVIDLPNTGDWSVIGYNTGSFNHTIQVTFTVRRIVEPPKDLMLVNDTGPYLQLGEG